MCCRRERRWSKCSRTIRSCGLGRERAEPGNGADQVDIIDIFENGSARAICWVPATPVAICFQTSFEIMGKQVAGFVDNPRLNLGSNAGPKAVNAGSKLVGRYSRSAELPRANITRDRFNVASKCIHGDKSSSVEISPLLIPISDPKGEQLLWPRENHSLLNRSRGWRA